MRIRFWGTRGSIPAPLKPGEVREKLCQAILGLPAIDPHDEAAVRAYVEHLPPLRGGTAGGNTPCVEIQAGDVTLVMDAGSGLRELGGEMMKGPFGVGQGTLHLFISHPHWDHIHGFTMFVPAFIPGNRIFIYGVHDLPAAFGLQHQFITWPVLLDMLAARIEFVPLQVGVPCRIGTVQVDTLKNNHPGDSYSFRFTDSHSVLVYASDAEYKQLDPASLQPTIDFFRGADALIFDSQYTLREAWQKIDWGHGSALIGTDLARAAGVKKLVLFHHDPTYSDAELEQIQADAVAYQAQNPNLPACEVLVAYEGLELDLTPGRAVRMQRTSNGETAILTPARIFDELGVEQLSQQLAGAVEPALRSVLDLSEVETLTTGGLKALVTWQQAQPAIPMVLAAPSEHVRRVIELAGYKDCFAVYPSVAAALAAVAARQATQLPGQVIGGRYQIEKLLGESSLGVVLEAVDTWTNRVVALKILSPTFSPETLERLGQQARQIMALDHPLIVKVLSWESDAVASYVVEELIEAPTLEEVLREARQPLSNEQALSIAQNVSQALEYAHSRGVIHGDLKPANIFLTPEGARLTGFGLGRLAEGRSLLDLPLLFLSPTYLAPEQILGQPLDAYTDMYALGVIMYQLLTGRAPFTGESHAVLRAHLSTRPQPPGELNPRLSPPLEHMIIRLLAKNPHDRPTGLQTWATPGSQTVFAKEAASFLARSLVGRERQLLSLLECWDKARRGHGQLVFITGEPGIGKTSLAQQAAAQSGASIVLAGYAEEREGEPAYHLFTQVLRAYLATVPPEVADEQARQLLGNLSRLVPEIRQMLPDLPAPLVLQPAQERLRLMGNVTRFIQRATQERPWFLILDGLQWADRDSLELLRYLGRHLGAMPLLIVGTYRDTEVAAGHPLWETLQALGRDLTFRCLHLEPLDETETGQILSALWRQPAPAHLIARIYQHTGGNPFYVEEVARALVDEGHITQRAGRWEFSDLKSIILPASVREAVLRRVETLPPGTQELLRQASVLGQVFYFEDLYEMSGLSEWETLERLDPALKRRLIREIQDAGGEAQLCFHHVGTRQILYHDLGVLQRRLLHRQAGEALERRAGGEERRVDELAHHFGQAGEYQKAAVYSLQTAQQAQAAYAGETALLWYNRTLEVLDQLGVEPRQSLAGLEMSVHRGLGQVLTIMGRRDEARRHCDRAWALLDKLPPSPELERHRADLCYQVALSHENGGEYAQALEWIDKGLAYLDRQAPCQELARLYSLSGLVHVRLGRYPEAQDYLQQALSIAQATQLRQVEADSLRSLGSVAWHSGREEEAAAYFELAMNIYREIGDRQGEAHSLINLGSTALRIRQYNQARRYYEQALQIYREIGDQPGASAALHNLGVIARDEGNYVAARACAEQVLHLEREGGDRRVQATALENLGTIALFSGDYAAAQGYLEQALNHMREIGDRAGEGETLGFLGRLFYHTGDHASACEASRQAWAIAQVAGSSFSKSLALAGLGDALVALGRADEARVVYQQALSLQPRREYTFPARAWAGMAQLALDQADLLQARACVEEILHHLETHRLASFDEPFHVYLVCYRVLRASQDARSGDILATAHHLLQAWAATMTDDMRRSFLENVAAHREIVQAFEGQAENQ